MKQIQKIGKFYQKIIMNNVGIFIFAGIMMVAFGENGWFPNASLNRMATLVYTFVLPIVVAHECGSRTGYTAGGVVSVIALTGILVRDEQLAFLGAMTIGPLAGVLAKRGEEYFNKEADFRMKMLARNMSIAISGAVLALASYYLFVPILKFTIVQFDGVIEYLVKNNLFFILSVIVEPAKVFFLNNLMNHAALVPLGIEQLQHAGSSILFLVEANPGPGLGVLFALLLMRKPGRNEPSPASAIVAHAIGGIHEVYFPYVLSDLKLILPLILGGMAGNAYFSFAGAGLQGPASPGSILIILLMAGKTHMVHVFLGMALSTTISFGIAMLLLGWERPREETDQAEKEALKKSDSIEYTDNKYIEQRDTREDMDFSKGAPVLSEPEKQPITHIAVICDGGLGSSAMGAALLRRNLSMRKITGVTVEAYAADLVPEHIPVLLCQKDYFPYIPEELKVREIYTVDNLVQKEGFDEIIEEIIKRA